MTIKEEIEDTESVCTTRRGRIHVSVGGSDPREFLTPFCFEQETIFF